MVMIGGMIAKYVRSNSMYCKLLEDLQDWSKNEK